MARYSIEEKTLTDMAMAIRGNLQGNPGELRLETTLTLTHDNQSYDWDISALAVGSSNYKFTLKDVQFASANPDSHPNLTLHIEPAAYTTGWGNEAHSFYWSLGDIYPFTDIMENVDNSAPLRFKLLYSNASGDSVTFTFIFEPIDKNGNSFGYTPQEMIDIVNAIAPTPTPEELTVTGNCSFRFAHGGWDWFIEKYGNLITTKNITTARSMFNDISVKKIPFEINFDSSTNMNASNMFSGSSKLIEMPILNGFKPVNLDYMFNACSYFIEFPEDYATNWDWSYLNSTTSGYSGSAQYMFSNCLSLRKLPMAVFAGGNPYATYSYSIFSNMANGCQLLDEIIDLPNPHYKATYNQTGYANVFNATIKNCFRLKNFTFAKMEPMNWAQQELDFSANTGWASRMPIGIYKSYNHGEFKPGHITEDKEVKDDATYQALKNDPDWFTQNVAYSRYNHDSAVATINSLPDCSAYQTSGGGKANTIKFKGVAGELTDGGAINTLTEEEIAVAAAKGWTVSLV